MSRVELCLALAVIACSVSAAQTTGAPKGKTAACAIVHDRVSFPCPENWSVVGEYHDPYADEMTIGNFPDTPENHNRRSGPGMATISISGIPKGYEDLDRWIWVGRKNAPDAIETKLELTNQTTGKVSVVCLTAPENSGPAFTSCFFQIRRVPLLLELSYRAQDPKKGEYRTALQRMIERASPVR